MRPRVVVWLIMANSKYQGTEILGECDSLKEAEHLAAEYKMAYGAAWAIWIKKRIEVFPA